MGFRAPHRRIMGGRECWLLLPLFARFMIALSVTGCSRGEGQLSPEAAQETALSAFKDQMGDVYGYNVSSGRTNVEEGRAAVEILIPDDDSPREPRCRAFDWRHWSLARNRHWNLWPWAG